MFAEPLLLVVAAAFGAILGSFLNVCVYRLPRNESVVRPRSRCPSCGALIAWYDNVPVVSWLALGGRCRSCRARISVQYPLVELVIALAWAGSLWWKGSTFDAVSAAVLVTLLVGILLTDARHFIIPDEFTLGGLGAALALSFVTDLGIVGTLIGAAVGFVVMWAVKAAGDYAVRKGWIGGREVQQTLGDDEPAAAMGGGDVKMMAMVGAFLGWQGALATIFLGSLAGSIVFLPFLFRERKPLVPFGVFLSIGAFVTLLAGGRLAVWYGLLVGG